MAGFRIVQKQIHPPEADPVAGKFESSGDEVDRLADAIGQAYSSVSAAWRGGSASMAYLSRLEPLPNQLKSLASNLRRWATEIRGIKVTIDVQEPLG